MTPEIWKAKKIVDSTLHPGQYARAIDPNNALADAQKPLRHR
jgi:hypothetical protein